MKVKFKGSPKVKTSLALHIEEGTFFWPKLGAVLDLDDALALKVVGSHPQLLCVAEVQGEEVVKKPKKKLKEED